MDDIAGGLLALAPTLALAVGLPVEPVGSKCRSVVRLVLCGCGGVILLGLGPHDAAEHRDRYDTDQDHHEAPPPRQVHGHT